MMCLYFPKVDLFNRITKVKDHKGKVVTCGYDATGNQTSIGYPDGTSVTKTHDLVNIAVPKSYGYRLGKRANH